MYGSSGTSSVQILSNKLNKCEFNQEYLSYNLQRVFSYRNKVINNKDNQFAKNVGNYAAKLLLLKKIFFIGLSEKIKLFQYLLMIVKTIVGKCLHVS